ncbi:hypothetical protein H7I53_18035 [Mycolicibacterium pulveris]|uniref:hypothetical protein n=1 Tax=Mycolicibacterium pulveris TaxID=36813 RepID=UPI0021F30A32|nr:hypothetical protein [Mycolicibacterium pulveris]MCV6982115.1 hypothetical protein [Mycolicibacterium pulveris]
MAREYARIRISINSDDDFANLTPEGQWFYTRIVIPEPTLNHCGVFDWRPARMLTRARGLTIDYLTAAAADCERGRFVLFDPDTEEGLARSYIRSEELLRNPKMAVAVMGAYRAVASKTLRAAIVTEIRRANSEHPEYSCWGARDIGLQLAEIMAHKSSDEVRYVDTITNPNTNQISNPITNRNTNHNGNHIGNAEPVQNTNPITDPHTQSEYQSKSVPIPCSMQPADTSLQHATSPGGEPKSGTSPHQPHPLGDEPPRRCTKHEDTDDPPPCGECADARRANDRWQLAKRKHDADTANAQNLAAINERRTQAQALQDAINNCPLGCAQNDGYTPTGTVCNHNPNQQQINARGLAAVKAALAGQPPDDQPHQEDPESA